MPGVMVYKKDDKILLRATVLNAEDKGGIVVDIGGRQFSVEDRVLDGADTRPASDRPLTPEEEAEKEMKEQEQHAAPKGKK